jgi:acylphosphatase
MTPFVQIIVISVLFLLHGSAGPVPSEPKIDKNCCYKEMKLYGKIKFVENFPDIKVQIVENFPDLKVKLVENFPDDCGEWQIVENFPDLKVQIVENFPDIKVKFVNNFPGLP